MMLNAKASMQCLHVLTFANYHLTGSAAEADLNESHWVSWGSRMSAQNVMAVRLCGHLWLRYLSLDQAH